MFPGKVPAVDFLDTMTGAELWKSLPLPSKAKREAEGYDALIEALPLRRCLFYSVMNLPNTTKKFS